MREWLRMRGIAWRTLLVFFGFFLAGAVCATVALVLVMSPQSQDIGLPLRDLDSSFTYIRPLLACNVGAMDPSPELAPLANTFAQIIADEKSNGTIEDASVYFRILDSGLWTAVNDDTGYVPASLMKVPVLMAYLKQAENDPTLLTKSFTITEDPLPETVQDIPPDETVLLGHTYTIAELLRLMSAYSDNRALNVLMAHVDMHILDDTLDDLGIPTPENMAGYTITPRLYSRLFRVLYNATYLNDTLSEQALSVLAASTYHDGLVAGTAPNTAIAHKFGEAAVTLANGTPGHELHDCGIVYAKEPYAICVMTKGANVDELSRVIAGLSTAAFAEPLTNMYGTSTAP